VWFPLSRDGPKPKLPLRLRSRSTRKLAEGHTSLAFIYAFADWNWAASEKEFERALELDPGYWGAPYWYALVLCISGRNEEAERQVTQARALEPLSPTIAHVAAWNSIASRRYTEAVDRCLRALEIDADYPLLRLWLGIAYEQLSRHEEAIRELRTAVQLLGGLPFSKGVLAHAQATAGNHAEASRLLGEIIETAERMPAEAYSAAIVSAALGRKDQAFEWLARACDCRSSWLTMYSIGDPRLDMLRSDPRFESIRKRM
jgi:tetratricopeptide (TPR) repeat protein